MMITKKSVFSRKSFAYSLCALAFTIPLTIQLNSVAIVIVAVFSLGYFIFNREEWKTKKIEYTPILLFGGLYLGAIVGFLNSSNISLALFDLEQKLSWIVLPLVFFLGPEIKKKESINVIVSFLLSVCLLSCFSFFYTGFLKGGLSLSRFTWDGSFLLDRVYLSLYCVCGFFWLLYLLVKPQSVKNRILLGLMGIILVLSLINTFVKISVFIVLIISSIFILKYIIRHQKFILLSMLLLMVAGLIYGLSHNLKAQKFTHNLIQGNDMDFNEFSPAFVNSINTRFIIWRCAIKALKENNNWLYGAGTGDTHSILDDCYVSVLGKDEPYFVPLHYNSHNQLFSTWLTNGLIFAVVLILQFILFLKNHLTNNCPLGVYLTLAVLMACLTESVFETQKGIVFYTFFQLLLSMNLYPTKIQR